MTRLNGAQGRQGHQLIVSGTQMTLGSFDYKSVGLGSMEDRMIDLFHSMALLLNCAPDIDFFHGR